MGILYMVTGCDAAGKLVGTAWAYSRKGADAQGEWLKHPDRDEPASRYNVERTEQGQRPVIQRLDNGVLSL